MGNRNVHAWKHKTEDGEKREVRAEKFGSRWRIQAKLKSDETISPQTIRGALERRFDTGYIDEPKVGDIEVKRGDAGWEMTADYEKAVKLFGNLHLLLQFNKTVVIN